MPFLDLSGLNQHHGWIFCWFPCVFGSTYADGVTFLKLMLAYKILLLEVSLWLKSSAEAG